MRRALPGACASHETSSTAAQQAHSREASPAALPSWQDGPARAAIVKFIDDAKREGSSTYVSPQAAAANRDSADRDALICFASRL